MMREGCLFKVLFPRTPLLKLYSVPRSLWKGTDSSGSMPGDAAATLKNLKKGMNWAENFHPPRRM